jgi:uncharacterized coiled-coil protein SlyX
MDVERTIEFILKNEARMDARFDAKFAKADARFVQAEKRLDRLERVVAQNNRTVTRLASYGVSLRSDVRRVEKGLAQITEKLSETDDKLNALIEIVDRNIRGNGKRGEID